ncbi:glycosyltransferase family 2 protein [Fournierella massiliensis]|uniref:glycosyltransferase family 2 protein n=1 Tax=Allofournierella massiliensis TaxID=1650663 RepID=UPI00352281F5
MDKPLISVIVPIYNVEKYLRRCIDSLVGQTYPNLEIVLVNDGSPDNCGEICDKYAQNNENIKVLHQKNQGLSAARNNGVKYSRGEYICFVDPDDYLPNDSIEYLQHIMEESHADLAAGGRVTFKDNESVTIGKEINELWCYNTEEALSKICYAKRVGVSAWAKLYPRFFVEQYPYPIGKVHEDLATTYKIVAQCEKVVVSSKVVYYYFQRNDSIMNCSIREKHIEDGMAAAKEELEFMKKYYPSVVPAAKYRCCFKVIEYIPRLLKHTEQNAAYFKRLQNELRPFLFDIIKDGNASIGFKARCIIICVGYTPTRLLWKLVAKVKGRTLA